MATSSIVRLKCADSDASIGWIARLINLRKGYRVSERPLAFGRTAVLIRSPEAYLHLVQGGNTAVKTTLAALSAEQAQILSDLDSIGMLAR